MNQCRDVHPIVKYIPKKPNNKLTIDQCINGLRLSTLQQRKLLAINELDDSCSLIMKFGLRQLDNGWDIHHPPYLNRFFYEMVLKTLNTLSKITLTFYLYGLTLAAM